MPIYFLLQIYCILFGEEEREREADPQEQDGDTRVLSGFIYSLRHILHPALADFVR